MGSCASSTGDERAEAPHPASGTVTRAARTPTPKRERKTSASDRQKELIIERHERREPRIGSTDGSTGGSTARSTNGSANVADVEHFWKLLQEQALQVGDYEIKWIHIVVFVVCLVMLCICIKCYRIRRKINEKASADVASIPDPGSMV